MESAFSIRPARADDLGALEEIRLAAFTPVFASFRGILGDVVYEAAQRHEDEAQADLLADLLGAASPWRVFLAESTERILGFVSIRSDPERGTGEIGLNAVHPNDAGRGIGTRMYEFALDEMRREGLRVATVATGGDPSHAAARRAYTKAGFDLSIPSVWMCREL